MEEEKENEENYKCLHGGEKGASEEGREGKEKMVEKKGEWEW